jgi:UMF1 family MFS transporter
VNPVATLRGLSVDGRARTPFAWALYDFANTIFSFAVISNAIGLLLTQGMGDSAGNLWLGVASAAAVGLNALVSPVLGKISDRGGRRLPFLAFFTVLTIIPCVLIPYPPIAAGIVLYCIALFSYQAALIYYEATLPEVSTPTTRGRVSGLGIATAYSGSVTVAIVLLVGGFSVDQRFIVAAVLFAIFAIPIFVFVKEPPARGPIFMLSDVGNSWNQIFTTIREAREVPHLSRFLLGRFFYTDALNTVVVVMSVFAVRAVGFSDQQALMVLLVLTLFAIGAGLVWGVVADRIGPKRTLMIVLSIWVVGLLLAGIFVAKPIFLVAGALIGSGMGGMHVSDRVLMLRLSPPDKLGQFFGIYGLVGKASQVIGVPLYTFLVWFLFPRIGTAAYQVAILSLLGTMLIGLFLVRGVPDGWRGSGEPNPEE